MLFVIINNKLKKVYMERDLEYHHKLPITIHKLKYLAMVDKQLSTYLLI